MVSHVNVAGNLQHGAKARAGGVNVSAQGLEARAILPRLR